MLKKIFICFTLSIFSIVISNADIKLEKVAVINLDEVITTVFSGKSGVLQDIKKDKEELQTILNKIKENIAKLDALKLKTQDSNQRLEIDKKIDEQEKLYNSTYKLKGYEIEKKLGSVKKDLLKEVYVQVKKIAESEGYSIVFDSKSDSIFYYSVDADITHTVIEFFNKNYGDKKEGTH